MNLTAVQETSSAVTNQNKSVQDFNSDIAEFSPILLKEDSLQTLLLTNKDNLQEVYNLRVKVWEHKGDCDFVNRELFPNGWYDELDESAYHWITINGRLEIVAAARLNIFHSLKDSPYFEATRHLQFSDSGSHAFYSRLVVHPDYRCRNLSKQLYQQRAAFCNEQGIRQAQLFTNNPYVISMYQANGFNVAGQGMVSYHPALAPHSVHVLAKGYQ